MVSVSCLSMRSVKSCRGTKVGTCAPQKGTGGGDREISDFRRKINLLASEGGFWNPNAHPTPAQLYHVTRRAPPFGLASTCPGGVEMPFPDLKRWVKIFDFDRNPNPPQWVDFKKTKSADLYLYRSLVFCPRLCQRRLKHPRAGPNFAHF